MSSKKFISIIGIGMIIISFTSILLVLFSDIDRIVIAYGDMIVMLLYSVLMIIIGVKKGILNL